MEAARLGTASQLGCRVFIGGETDSKITATRTARFVADTAVDCNPPKGVVFVRENRHPDQDAELVESLPRGINGFEESLGIYTGKGANTDR